MNVFYLDTDPIVAAQYHCDKHVVKMILESTQLLATAHRTQHTNVPQFIPRAVFINHPWAKWTRYTKQNYEWLLAHACALCTEYTYRYGKIHKWAIEILPWLSNNIIGKVGGLTKPPLCMPSFYYTSSIVKAYRKYYCAKQYKMTMKWTKRSIPLWFKRSYIYDN